LKFEQEVAFVSKQVPLPLHTNAGFACPEVHAAAAHSVPAAFNEHWRAPSHMPVFPQEPSCAHSLSGSVPPATARHSPSIWPFFALRHDSHKPPHALPQQTPSAQTPEEHSSAAPQVWPFARFPPHKLLMHFTPCEQSPSPAQVVLQTPAAQPYWPQFCAAEAVHTPLPSHMEADLAPSAVHEPAAHIDWFDHTLHEPAPSHIPVVPQVAASFASQSFRGSLPSCTLAQTPFAFPVCACKHERQEPLQAFSQQTPSTQESDAQCSFFEHSIPWPSFTPASTWISFTSGDASTILDRSASGALELPPSGTTAPVDKVADQKVHLASSGFDPRKTLSPEDNETDTSNVAPAS
jgi:hypothetical protein